MISKIISSLEIGDTVFFRGFSSWKYVVKKKETFDIIFNAYDIYNSSNVVESIWSHEFAERFIIVDKIIKANNEYIL